MSSFAEWEGLLQLLRSCFYLKRTKIVDQLLRKVYKSHLKLLPQLNWINWSLHAKNLGSVVSKRRRGAWGFLAVSQFCSLLDRDLRCWSWYLLEPSPLLGCFSPGVPICIGSTTVVFTHRIFSSFPSALGSSLASRFRSLCLLSLGMVADSVLDSFRHSDIRVCGIES